MGKDLKGNPLPPGIMQRKSGIYRGRFYYKGETYTKDNADLKKLVQEMEDLRYEVKHGLKGKGDNITLDTWFDIWLNTHKKRTIKESTQVRYDDFYRRYIKKQIGKQRVADFNPIILERLLQNMADDDYSTKTIRDVYNILNAMFKYAVHNRILTFNPCAGVEVPKTKTKQIRVLTVKEQREVLEHAKERIHENLIQVALGTGMRGGELLGLTWDDVDFRKREISVNKTLVYIKDKETKKYVFKYQTPKTKNSVRTVIMPQFLCDEMQDCLKLYYSLKSDDRIFPVTKYYLKHEMERGCKASGVKKIRVHDLRHSHVSLLINMGYTALAIGKRVGHSAEKITYRYAHLFPSVQQDMAEQLDAENMEEELNEVEGELANVG